MVAGSAIDLPSASSEAALSKLLNAAPTVDLARHLRAALQRRRWPAVAGEIVRLSRGPGRLTPHEYFYYRLYDEALGFAAKQAFVGKRAQERMHVACNDPTWYAVVNDKLLFQAAMRGFGLPTPTTLAVFHPSRRLDGAAHLTTARMLEDFLREEMSYPFFAKPVDGIFSLGAISIDAYDRAGDELLAADGTRIGVGEFVRRCAEREAGYLFQERMRPHREIVEIFGPRLSTVRIVVLLASRGPEIFRAVCKVPTGSNIADNFWRSGNMLAAVDVESGEMKRVVKGVGEDHTSETRHPDTGAPLIGLRLPHWAEAARLASAAAASLPAVRTQAWDIALCESGPVLVEVNYGGDLNLPQLAWGEGALDERFRAHLRACGYKSKL